jgi:hypothetical protein
MPYASEPVSDTAALTGDLFEDSRAPITDDVVVALHS